MFGDGLRAEHDLKTSLRADSSHHVHFVGPARVGAGRSPRDGPDGVLTAGSATAEDSNRSLRLAPQLRPRAVPSQVALASLRSSAGSARSVRPQWRARSKTQPFRAFPENHREAPNC